MYNFSIENIYTESILPSKYYLDLISTDIDTKTKIDTLIKKYIYGKYIIKYVTTQEISNFRPNDIIKVDCVTIENTKQIKDTIFIILKLKNMIKY